MTIPRLAVIATPPDGGGSNPVATAGSPRPSASSGLAMTIRPPADGSSFSHAFRFPDMSLGLGLGFAVALFGGVVTAVASRNTRVGWAVFAFVLAACGTDPGSSETGCTIPASGLSCYGDDDGDSHLNINDECPSYGADEAGGQLLGPNGCPIGCHEDQGELICDTDSDGDGVPDSIDQCPDESHPGTADGCAPDEDPGTPPDDVPPEENPGPVLGGRQTYQIPTDSTPACVLGALSAAGEVSLLWQENGGISYLRGNITEETIEGTPQPLETGSADFNSTCYVKKGVAIASDGSRTLLYSRGREGDRVGIYFQRRGSSGEVLQGETEVASFPTPPLGDDGHNYFASIASADNDDFVIAWTDRDRVKATRYNANGEVVWNVNPVNETAPLGATRKNPDIAINSDGTITIVWQEGDGFNGPVKRADLDANGGRITEQYITAADDTAPLQSLLRPSVAASDGMSTMAWSQDSQGSLQVFEGTAPMEDLDVFRYVSGPSSSGVLLPGITMDEQGRVVIGWVNPENETQFGCYLLGLGDPLNSETDVVRTGTLIGRGNGIPHLSVFTNPSGDQVVSAYAGEGRTIEVDTFNWN